ncbi:hypothetical protein [Arenimonas donghaensis]|uniref:Uncharacterized protein n=1 Tax=Arenimonas donghaensis DSM 18148 = HO3-R19 TaxID=1121014 RepID=A0A087MH62_9GAMM|nr:hypothetical protein [Arenimonas donghaensis]KFL36215.1 hypothetical protein N788_04825 [Arenimonas donghaensis DSM 18148 = HO3-R19]
MNQTPGAAPRSTFVTAVGWIFLAISAFGLLMGILQNIMLHTMFPQDAFAQIASDPGHPQLPGISLWMIQNMRLVAALVLVTTVLHVVASIGLLRRWNWGRLLFIGLMAFGILSNLGGLVFQGQMMMQMHESFSDVQATQADMPELGWFMVAIWVFSLGIALAFAALYAWIIKRLVAPEVVAEFRR